MGFILSDEEYIKDADYFLAMGEKVQDILDEFIKVVEEMYTQQEISGMAATNVYRFVCEMRDSLKKDFNDGLVQQSSEMKEFIEKTDEADSFLY